MTLEKETSDIYFVTSDGPSYVVFFLLHQLVFPFRGMQSYIFKLSTGFY